jgi:hypothetical protein
VIAEATADHVERVAAARKIPIDDWTRVQNEACIVLKDTEPMSSVFNPWMS